MTEHPDAEDTALEFFNNRLAFAIERDRLEKSTHDYPFNQVKERTPASATQGDVMDAAKNITDPADAKRFVEGYAQDLNATHGLSPEQASEIALENLTMGAEQCFSDSLNAPTLAFWRTILRTTS